MSSPGVDRPYRAVGGIYRDEAIMLLRRFYLQENEKGMGEAFTTSDQTLILEVAPEPRPKKDRQLKTLITTQN